jgi:hypothetical protein
LLLIVLFSLLRTGVLSGTGSCGWRWDTRSGHEGHDGSRAAFFAGELNFLEFLFHDVGE